MNRDESLKTHAPWEPEAHGERDPIVRFRVAEAQDALGISKVETAAYGPYSTPLPEVLNLISSELAAIARGEIQRKTWVATAQDEIVGFAKCRFLPPYNQQVLTVSRGWMLSGLTVSPKWRRRGIGRQMVQLRLDWLAQRTHAVFYSTDPENHASVSLHTGFGFVELEGPMTALGLSGKPIPQRWFQLMAHART